MAIRHEQNSEYFESAFNSADVYICKVVIPYDHRLIAARTYCTDTVLTGTLKIKLAYAAANSGEGGALLDYLENADLKLDDAAVSATHALFHFDLGSTAQGTNVPSGVIPAWTVYFLILTSTNSADRYNNPSLVITVDDEVS